MENDRKGSRGEIERYDLESLLRRPSLRTSIPRRISQIHRHAITAEETTCGIGCIRGKWLQSFANRNSYIFTYGVLGSIYGSYYAYFYGVITTLEKRFKLSSQTIGLSASAGEIAQIIMCFILSLCVPKVHKPKLIGVGVLMMATSTVLFTFPHFIYEHKYFTNRINDTDNRRCARETQACTENIEGNGSIIFLILAQGLHGIGGSFYFIVGKSYEYENIDKNPPAALLSILLVLKILGPALGYWLSSVVLKIFEYPKLITNITENEPHWVGAWWLGSLVIGFILIVPGILLILFPTTLPKVAIRRIHSQNNEVKENGENLVKRTAKMVTLKRLYMNPTFNSTRYTAISNITGFMAYFIFLPKYVETQFLVSASSANLITGSVILIFSAIGIVAANSVITRYRPSARTLSSWSLITDILSVGVLVSYIYFNCEANDNIIKVVANLPLNATCECIDPPVCEEYHQTFILPCRAKCENILYVNKTKNFENCKQALELFNVKNVFKDFCPVDCHSNFLKFILITCFMAFIFATGHTSNYWFESRYEEMQGKSFMISSGMSFVGFLTSISAPIIFGYIFDEFCLLWEENCHRRGNCWLYDNESLRFSVNLAAIGFSIIGIIFDLRIWLSVKNLILFNETNSYFNDSSQR